MSRQVNLRCYETLGERWYEADDDPVALLRAESRLLGSWLVSELSKSGEGRKLDVLDLGCGAGLISNQIAKAGHRVRGIDLSDGALDVARRHDETGSVEYHKMDACDLRFPDLSFDAVCAMDLLEHIEKPELLVRETARVLRKGGRFFFHTFNRNRLSHLIVIKGVEWFVANTPHDLHIYRLFVRPKEMETYLRAAGMIPEMWRGVRPVLSLRNFLALVLRRRVPQSFEFRFHSSLVTGYVGIAEKSGR